MKRRLLLCTILLASYAMAADKDAQTHLAQIKSAAAPIIAAQAAAPAPATPDYIEEIKIWAQDNGLDMSKKDWDNYNNLLASSSSHSLKIHTPTNCEHAAKKLFCLFSGKTPDIQTLGYQNEFRGSLADLESGNLSNLAPQYTILEALAQPSKKSKHLIFFLKMHYGKYYHAFTIEKQSDSHTTYWRLYQAWEEQFSITEWLGLHTFNKTSRHHTYYLKYGRGKKLDAKEFLNFLQECLPDLQLPLSPTQQKLDLDEITLTMYMSPVHGTFYDTMAKIRLLQQKQPPLASAPTATPASSSSSCASSSSSAAPTKDQS